MIEFVGKIKGDTHTRWFSLKLSNPAVVGKGGNSKTEEGEITLSFDDKITESLKKRLGLEFPGNYLNKKRIIIKIE